MADGGSHFNCVEVQEFCESIGMKLHIVAAYSSWLNGLLEGSNGILLNALKRLCTPVPVWQGPDSVWRLREGSVMQKAGNDNG